MAVSCARLALHDGQTPRPLQEYGISTSSLHPAQTRREKPRAKTPHSR